MSKTIKASAPGRLDVMGGIADYSGSLVLQKSITQQTHVELTLRADYHCSIQSRLSTNEVLNFTGNYRDYLLNGEVDYKFARQKFNQSQTHAWVAYILGCALVLQKEKGIDFKGFEITLVSEVPNGKGVASSASVEVASMRAMAQAFNLSFSGTELPRLAQRVENLIVGAPCGLMDQLASSFGKPNSLLPIICQPDQVQKEIQIPSDVSFVGIDSGIRHHVGAASYSDVRCAAFMGYTIIARSLGVSKQDIITAKQTQNFSKLPYRGYLSSISVDDFEKIFQKKLPNTMTGRDFLEQYDETIDAVTIVDKNRSYAIASSTAHPVYENFRVKQFQDCLYKLNNEQIGRENMLQQMGNIMLASHKSYSQCGLGTERTDEIVSMAIQAVGIFGARITGGGNGGTVCMLAVGEEGRSSVIALHKLLCERFKENLASFW
jgi:L-arabinokinase